MSVQNLVSMLDEEIVRLQQARKILTSGASSNGKTFHPIIAAIQVEKPRKARVMSAAARKLIGDAQKKRWATQKRAKKAETKAAA